MRTNVVIDNDLLEEAFSVSKARTKKDLTELAGSINFCKGFDHKKVSKTKG